MFARNSALVISLYLLIAAVVAGLGLVLLRAYSGPGGPLDTAEMARDVDPIVDEGSRTAPHRAEPAYNVAVVAQANDRIGRLQATLERTSELLEQRTALLHEKSAECKRLQAELDESLKFAFTVLEADVQAAAANPAGGMPPAEALRAELERLKNDLNKARAQMRDYSEQVDWLTSELVQSKMDLAEFQTSMDRDLVTVLRQQQQVEAASATAFARIGEAAVPTLIEMLEDERPEVRRWAAATIERIGPRARDATDALTVLLGDPDPLVKQQAQRALKALEM